MRSSSINLEKTADSFPIFESKAFFQPSNCFPFFQITGLQKALYLGSTPKGKPKYFISQLSKENPNTPTIFYNLSCEQLIIAKELLLMFTSNPDISSNIWKMDCKLKISCSSPKAKNKSIINKLKMDTLHSYWKTIKQTDLALSTSLLQTSTTKVNRNKDKGSPAWDLSKP